MFGWICLRISWNSGLFVFVENEVIWSWVDGFFNIDVNGWRLFSIEVWSTAKKSAWLKKVDVTNCNELLLSEASSGNTEDWRSYRE